MPDVKMSPTAFEWALACAILGPEGTSLTFRRRTANEIGGFSPELLWFEGTEFLMRLARRGAGYLIADQLWQKFWSSDAITSNWSRAGPNLLIFSALQSEYFARHRKLRTYLATRIIIGDLKYRLFGAFWRDLRNFRAAGFIDNNIIGMYRNHREIGGYRRKMSDPEALAGMRGPPDSWH